MVSVYREQVNLVMVSVYGERVNLVMVSVYGERVNLVMVSAWHLSFLFLLTNVLIVSGFGSKRLLKALEVKVWYHKPLCTWCCSYQQLHPGFDTAAAAAAAAVLTGAFEVVSGTFPAYRVWTGPPGDPRARWIMYRGTGRGYLWDNGHLLPKGVQSQLGGQEPVDGHAALGLGQSEQGRDERAFPGAGPSHDAHLWAETERRGG